MYWSWILMVIGLTGLLLLAFNKLSGWFIGFFAQIVWVIYAIVTHQYGFIVSAIAYATVNVLGIITFKKSRSKEVYHYHTREFD